MAEEKKASKVQAKKVKGVSKRLMAGQVGKRDFFKRLLNPHKWSLKWRFLYFTGTLLILGSMFQIFFLGYSLENNITTDANSRLDIFVSHIQSLTTAKEDFLLSQALAVASNEHVQKGMAAEDRASIKQAIQPYADALRLNLSKDTLCFNFIVPKGTSLLKTSNSNKLEEAGTSSPLFEIMLREVAPVQGLDVERGDIRVKAIVPVFNNGDLVGGVCASLALGEVLQDVVPHGYGAAVFLTAPDVQEPEGSATQTDAGLRLLGSYGDMSGVAVDSVLRRWEKKENTYERVGDKYFMRALLENSQSEELGALLVAYDSTLSHEVKRNRVYQLGGLFVSGAIILWLFLYLNVNRIEAFFSRLKRIVIASHSNDFAERFESDHVHCLDVLHCHNEECPVFRDPALVCYLETGSLAISPKWRDTCIFLNKYDKCENCPVYVLRKGDELAEMRNVVNTMMRLWSQFLGRTGHLLAYVLRSQEAAGKLPSLDEVSNRLEQMAKLTFFSHDIQGTVDKVEVYEQLAYSIQSFFGLSRYVLFEVDNDTKRIIIALDKMPDDSLCKREVLLSTEVCRAHRVAEDVISFYNPVLCPHFNCDTNTEVRCCLPIVMSGHVGAVFSFLAPKNQWESIRNEKLPIIRKYLDEAAPVLSSLRLLKLSKEQALRDPLTHCHNRRFLDEFISKYEPLSERDNKITGFLMADVDYFKQVNDEHGHEAGDAVLQQVVAMIKANIRRSDLLIRYGGEEFLILLQDVKPGMAFEVAEKIRIAIEQHRFELPSGAKLKKTISLGVSEHPEDGATLYKAIKFADVALYEGKNTGRNKVVRFAAEMWTGDEY